MQRVIIADASCLIILDNIGKLEILKSLFGEVTITNEVAAEYKLQTPDWIKVVAIKNIDYKKFLQSTIDEGEASAIVCAIETENHLLILDDYKARRVAATLHLKFTGTLGVLIEAKQKGLIEKIKPLIAQLRELKFRISNELEEIILKSVGE